MSFVIRGHQDLLFDPIGSVSNCHKAHTKLNMDAGTTVCAECGRPCDMYVPETDEEFSQPEIKENGEAYYKYERDGLEAVNKFNKAMGGRDE